MNSQHGSVIALVVMLIARWWDDSMVASVLWFAALAYILGGLLLKARDGYRRRLPYWTRESWRRYFTACAMFAAALLVCVAMAAAVDFRLPITGKAFSAARTVWVLVMAVCMLVGTFGLTSAVFWLGEGDDPAKPFTRFQRRPLKN